MPRPGASGVFEGTDAPRDEWAWGRAAGEVREGRRGVRVGVTAPGHVDCRKDSGRFSEGGGRRGRVLSRGMA